MRVDQSKLSGESHPVRKTTEPVLRGGLVRVEIPSLVFAGTSVVAGSGRMLVIATGMETEFGKIAHLTQSVGGELSPLQKEIGVVTKVVTAVAISIGILFFVLATFLAGMNLATDETNLIVANLARFEFNVPRIIARVNNPKNTWLFTGKMGVDVALNQAELMAHLIQEEMSLGDMMALLKLRKGQYAVVEEKVDFNSNAAGKAISELDLPEDCILIAVIRKGHLIVPHGNTVLEPLDEVLALVHTSQLQKLAGILGVPQE